MSRPQKLTGFLLLSVLLTVQVMAFVPVEAGWLKKKGAEGGQDPVKQVETFQPPPPEAIETYCEPIRQRVLAMNRKPVWVKLFNRFQVAHLKGEHKECILDIKTQEVEYLRHVDEPQAPSLPPLKIEESEASE